MLSRVSQITDGIDGIHADEEDGHRAESVYKIGSYANQFVHVLALIQSAATALDDPSAAPPAAFYLDVAIAIYHAGDCSLSDIKGTRAGEFDSSVDPNALTEAAFAAAQSDLTKENLETLLEEVEDAGLIAFLRAANRYANLMDQYAAAGDETLLRENQFEALAYFRVIEPIAQMLDADATELIENLFSQGEDEVGQLFLDDYQPVEEQVLPAINDILAAAGIDPEVFGTYTFDEGFDGYDPATYNTDDDE